MQSLAVRLGLPVCALASAGLLAAPLVAQTSPSSSPDAHRLWGEVRTVDGDVHEGFIRWDRNEGSWVDVLDGSKELPDENYQIWLQANRDGEPPRRTLELKGYRISWDEADPDFALIALSGLQFGHIQSLTPAGRDSVMVVTRGGQRLALFGGSTDIGPSMRELLVDRPGESTVELEWEDVERVTFAEVPSRARASSPRLYGTVADTTGREYTGYISWDLDEILESDVLDGEDPDGEDHNIEMGDIRSILVHRRSVTVTLNNGDTLSLSGSNDVDRGHRGVQLSDPSLGFVEIEWEELDEVTFSDAPASEGLQAFDGGHRLFGTLTTQGGEELTGFVRWDSDEEWSWEFLDGRSQGVVFKIELAQVDRIVRSEVFGATVTLADGRSFELDDANDVNWDNKGIMVSIGVSDPSDAQLSDWRYVPWDDFASIRFEHDPAPLDPSSGSTEATEPGGVGR